MDWTIAVRRTGLKPKKIRGLCVQRPLPPLLVLVTASPSSKPFFLLCDKNIRDNVFLKGWSHWVGMSTSSYHHRLGNPAYTRNTGTDIERWGKGGGNGLSKLRRIYAFAVLFRLIEQFYPLSSSSSSSYGLSFKHADGKCFNSKSERKLSYFSDANYGNSGFMSLSWSGSPWCMVQWRADAVSHRCQCEENHQQMKVSIITSRAKADNKHSQS